MDLKPFMVPAIVLLVMAAVVAALAIYRFMIARHQEFHLHTNAGEAQMVGHQVDVAKKLEAVDRWGKLMTTLTFVYFVVLAIVFFYREFQSALTPKY
jgi:hypothetical protein